MEGRFKLKKWQMAALAGIVFLLIVFLFTSLFLVLLGEDAPAAGEILGGGALGAGPDDSANDLSFGDLGLMVGVLLGCVGFVFYMIKYF
jgi:hypothetical protein